MRGVYHDIPPTGGGFSMQTPTCIFAQPCQALCYPYLPSTLSAINGVPASSLSTSTPYIARNARPAVRLPFHLISKALNRSPVLTTRSTSDCARERQK